MKTIREFTQIIGVIERGDAAADLTREVDKVLKACQEAAGPKTKAKGEVTLTLKFEVEGVYVAINASIASKTPKRPRSTTTYFMTADGELATQHPDQADMFDGPRDASARAS